MSCHCDGRSKPWHRHSVFYTALLLLESIRPRFSSDFLVTCLDFSLLLLTELNQLFRLYSAQANRTKYISLGKDRQSKNIRTRCIAWLRRHKKMSGGSLDRWPTTFCIKSATVRNILTEAKFCFIFATMHCSGPVIYFK